MKITTSILTLSVAASLFFSGCSGSKSEALALNEARFDTILDGKQVRLYTLSNNNGMTVQITNYGGRIVSLIVPDCNGNSTDVVWGYESIGDYLTAGDIYSGPLVGRFGNRIARGQFSIDGNAYQLSINNNPNHLHGGDEGFWGKVWDARKFKDTRGIDVLELSYLSPDGEDGYPGNLQTTVLFTLTDDNELRLEYSATTDKPTPINPTSHPYFNLHGTSEKSTNSHLLMVKASSYTPTDSVLIPTGEILPLAGTSADFSSPATIGSRTSEDGDLIMKYGGGGYDLNFVIDRETPKGVELVANLYEPENGISMDILTDQPGLQLYSGSGMNNTDIGKRGDLHRRYTGLALETQNFPDAPNQPNFPNAVLRPGETYTQTVIYKFSIK